MRSANLTGKVAQHLLDEVGVTCNKNAIPFDPTSPFVTSGIRLGTPAVTSRGMDEEAMKEIAKIISLTLKNPEDAASHDKARTMVRELNQRFPLYKDLAY
ncbi:Serine hydroxymethyltransferase [compost metagenome]